MARSSGTYSLPAGQPVVAGTTISDTVFNTLMADIANEITNSIPRDGTAPPTANLPMGNFKITGLGNGTLATDAAAFGQLTATNTVNTPAGNIAATTVQAALNELDTEKAKIGANSDITSLTAVTTINRTGGTSINGTNTNDDAAIGFVGEYKETIILSGSAVNLAVSSNVYNIASISLTAGDWDVSGNIAFTTASSTTVQYAGGCFNTSVAINGNTLARNNYFGTAINTPANGAPYLTMPTSRFSLAAPATIYLVGYAAFGVSTISAFGKISARRVR